jgi:hypothetical protein
MSSELRNPSRNIKSLTRNIRRAQRAQLAVGNERRAARAFDVFAWLLCRSKYLCQMMKSTADCLTNELLIQQLVIPFASRQTPLYLRFQSAWKEDFYFPPTAFCAARYRICIQLVLMTISAKLSKLFAEKLVLMKATAIFGKDRRKIDVGRKKLVTDKQNSEVYISFCQKYANFPLGCQNEAIITIEQSLMSNLET